MFEKRINIIAGHYGSGKSEISVNAAYAMKLWHEQVLLADMDIVNPFFRSADAEKLLGKKGIRLVAPLFANTNVDVPALVPEIKTALRNTAIRVILDVGGDEEGARVLGGYHQDISREDYDFYFVINRARPMTRSKEQVIEYLSAIEASSRLKVTKLLNNTHFLDQTTQEDIQNGQELSLEVSRATGIPLAADCVMEDTAYHPANDTIPVFKLNKNILLPF